MAKLNFQQLLFMPSVSYDPSEIILMCWLLKTVVLLNIVVETVTQNLWLIEHSKEQHLFEI